MADELFFDGLRYVSAGEAASSSGFTRDYIGRLCREGKIAGKLVGKSWYVEDRSFKSFLVDRGYVSEKRGQSLAQERTRQYRAQQKAHIAPASTPGSSVSAVVAMPGLISEGARTVQDQFTRAALTENPKRLRNATRISNTPPGVADAALRISHIPIYNVTPFIEFGHRFAAAFFAIALVFGSYALLEPQESAQAIILARGYAQKSLEAGYALTTRPVLLSMTENAQVQLTIVQNDPHDFIASAITAAADDMRVFISPRRSSVAVQIVASPGSQSAQVMGIAGSQAGELDSNRIETQELCVGSACVTPAEFLALLQIVQSNASSSSTLEK